MNMRARLRNILYITVMVLGFVVLVLDIILILTWRHP